MIQSLHFYLRTLILSVSALLLWPVFLNCQDLVFAESGSNSLLDQSYQKLFDQDYRGVIEDLDAITTGKSNPRQTLMLGVSYYFELEFDKSLETLDQIREHELKEVKDLSVYYSALSAHRAGKKREACKLAKKLAKDMASKFALEGQQRMSEWQCR